MKKHTKINRKNSPLLSIVIVNFNTKQLLSDCLNSIHKVCDEISYEVIVSDNGSEDGSIQYVKKKYPWVKLLENKTNLGFSKANNKARDIARGKYILFLNSDTVVHKNTLKETVSYLEKNHDVGSITCKIVLPDGTLDKDSRRSFPTPWVALTHLVLPLDRIFPTSKIFSKYWYGYKDENETHEVDVIQGAYHLSRKSLLDEVDWFDEDYFLDGEDIDLCWKIKQKGLSIIYYPKVQITHIKKASKKNSSLISRKRFVASGVYAMELFYKKRLWKEYPLILNYLIILSIRFVKFIRVTRLK